jgi:hypothetical protein
MTFSESSVTITLIIIGLCERTRVQSSKKIIEFLHLEVNIPVSYSWYPGFESSHNTVYPGRYILELFDDSLSTAGVIYRQIKREDGQKYYGKTMICFNIWAFLSYGNLLPA